MIKKYYVIRGGVFNLYEDEDITEGFSQDAALDEAYKMACDVYDSYAGLHGIMSEEDYIQDGEAENEDEAWELYREDRENSIEYEAVEITKEQYDKYFTEGLQ